MLRASYLIVVAALMAGCVTTKYEGEDHPYRVLMRDMKPHYKTLDNFSKDPALAKEAAAACDELVILGEKGQKMKPGFLKSYERKAHGQLFAAIASTCKIHAAYIRSGDVARGQAVYAELSEIKKRGHTRYKDQAKAARGDDE